MKRKKSKPQPVTRDPSKNPLKYRGQKTRRQSLRIPANLDAEIDARVSASSASRSDVIVSLLADALDMPLRPDGNVFE